MATLAAEASDQVLNFVKLSGLDFKIVETPFSLEIKIKKKFTKYNHGSQPTLSKQPKNVKPNSLIYPKSFYYASQPISPHSVTATNSQDVMAKPMDSTTLPLPFSTSNYGTMSTSSPFMIHPTSTYPDPTTSAPMPQATTFKVSKPKQPMNTFNTMKFQNIEKINSSTILRPRPPSLTAPPSPSPRTDPPPAGTPTLLKTPPPPRTPTGFPLATVSPGPPIDDEKTGVTKEEFKQLLSEHFERMNLDTTTIIVLFSPGNRLLPFGLNGLLLIFQTSVQC